MLEVNDTTAHSVALSSDKMWIANTLIVIVHRPWFSKKIFFYSQNRYKYI